MDETSIRRIGELARKSRTPAGLTEAEKAEQAALRKEYIASMKRNLRAQLDNIELIDEYGVHRPLQKSHKSLSGSDYIASEVLSCD